MDNEREYYTAADIRRLILQIALMANFSHTNTFREMHLYRNLKAALGEEPQMKHTANMAADAIEALVSMALQVLQLKSSEDLDDILAVIAEEQEMEELSGQVQSVITYVLGEKGGGGGR